MRAVGAGRARGRGRGARRRPPQRERRRWTAERRRGLPPAPAAPSVKYVVRELFNQLFQRSILPMILVVYSAKSNEI